MKRVLILLIMAFLISGGTVGILYQEGVGGMGKTKTVAEEDADEETEEGDEDASGVSEAALEAAREAREKAEADAAAAAEAQAQADAEAAAAAEAEAQAQAEAEAQAAADARAAKEARAPFYTFVVNNEDSVISVHNSIDGAGEFATVEAGSSGYVVGGIDGDRTLVFVNGMIGYLNTYNLDFTEIGIDEYPDALLNVTPDMAGTTDIAY